VPVSDVRDIDNADRNPNASSENHWVSIDSYFRSAASFAQNRALALLQQQRYIQPQSSSRD
jgi:hypothetical protein